MLYTPQPDGYDTTSLVLRRMEVGKDRPNLLLLLLYRTEWILGVYQGGWSIISARGRVGNGSYRCITLFVRWSVTRWSRAHAQGGMFDFEGR